MPASAPTAPAASELARADASSSWPKYALPPLAEAPTLEAGRVALRPHRLSDMEAFAAFYETARAEFMGAPRNRTHLFYGFASEVASWSLMGFGAWAVHRRDTGALIGQVAITQPPHFPEPEIGWTLFDGHEGQGFAFSTYINVRILKF